MDGTETMSKSSIKLANAKASNDAFRYGRLDDTTSFSYPNEGRNIVDCFEIIKCPTFASSSSYPENEEVHSHTMQSADRIHVAKLEYVWFIVFKC